MDPNPVIPPIERDSTPVNKKKTAKNTARKSAAAKKPRRFEPATERMAFRSTPAMKAAIQAEAIKARRTDSNYIRDVIAKHLESLPDSTFKDE
jgi:hypothetical protein